MLISLSRYSFAATYWVSTSGNNTNNCLSESAPCKTINHAVSLAKNPGDIVNIKSGTYKENSDGDGTNFFGITIGVAFRNSGTASKPIVVQAAPGHEGLPIIDGQGTNTLFMIGNTDYITIKNLQFHNAYHAAIHGRGSNNRISVDKNYSIGIQILNNYIYNTNHENLKGNIGTIRADQSKDWVVRNNKVHRVTNYGDYTNRTYGIQAYDTYNMLVEHNDFQYMESAVFFKDHSLLSDDGQGNRTYHNGSVIRYNTIGHTVNAIQFITNSNNGDEASNHYIHHNIIYDFSKFGFLVNMSNSMYNSLNLRIEHNVFDGTGNLKAMGISNDSMIYHTQKGNILVNLSTAIDLKDENDTEPALTYSNYNIFSDKFSVNVDRGGAKAKTISSLSAWRGVLDSQFQSVAVDNPDVNSIVSTSSNLFVNAGTRNYKLKSGSSALAFMDDGSNAGPYQYGTEEIGLLAGYPKYEEPVRPEAPVLR